MKPGPMTTFHSESVPSIQSMLLNSLLVEVSEMFYASDRASAYGSIYPVITW